MPTEHVDDGVRWIAGASVGRRSGRIKATIVKYVGEQWAFRSMGCQAVSTPAVNQTADPLHDRMVRAIKQIAQRADVPLEDIEVLGLCDHQTHPLTAAAVAELTGLTTVSHFAHRDQACGGRGFPLSPIPTWLLFHSGRE